MSIVGKRANVHIVLLDDLVYVVYSAGRHHLGQRIKTAHFCLLGEFHFISFCCHICLCETICWLYAFTIFYTQEYNNESLNL